MSDSERSAQPPPPPQGAGSIAEEKVERMQELEHGEERCGTLSSGRRDCCMHEPTATDCCHQLHKTRQKVKPVKNSTWIGLDFLTPFPC